MAQSSLERRDLCTARIGVRLRAKERHFQQDFGGAEGFSIPLLGVVIWVSELGVAQKVAKVN